MPRQTILLTLTMCSIGHATMLVLLAGEPNEPSCEQVVVVAPDWVDPNRVEGVILPAGIDTLSGDPFFTVPTGKFFREGRACDPDGHPFAVTCRTAGWSAACDLDVGTWALAGEVVSGPQYIVVSVTDSPPYADALTSDYTVCIWGRPPVNHAPILCGLGWLGIGLLTAR